MTQPTCEDIIAQALGRGPDVRIGSDADGYVFCRWRQFVGSYEVGPMPDAVFVVHVAGKPAVRHWDGASWSARASNPGRATLIPAHARTSWLVDGELDAVTFSVRGLTHADLNFAPARGMKFAFPDPLGVALARQILAESYAPDTEDRRAYIATLASTLAAHVRRAGRTASALDIPFSGLSGHRVHKIVNAILAEPEREHTLESLADLANLSLPHFSRVFKQAVGMSPHQFVLRTRIDHARRLLEETDLSVSVISDRMGFASHSHFCRAFQRLTRVTPSDYRAGASAA